MAASLSVSVVTYEPDLALVRNTLESLEAALRFAQQQHSLDAAEVEVIDNGPGERFAARLQGIAESSFAPPVKARLRSSQGNVGYGRGHNLALLASMADYHLILNPDVTLAEDALHQALQYMQANREVVMLAPEGRGPAGELRHLCRRYPTVLDLLLRGFAPAGVKRIFKTRLDRYEMHDLGRDAPTHAISLMSGCFMFCRRAPIAALGGFSDAFFLYMEDYDLSLRAGTRGELAFVPAVRIVHYGGNAARKGLRHILLFARSVVTFFNRHGWKWA